MTTRKYKITIRYVPTNTVIVETTRNFSEKGTKNSLQNFHIDYTNIVSGKAPFWTLCIENLMFQVTSELLKLSTISIEPIDSLPRVDFSDELS